MGDIPLVFHVDLDDNLRWREEEIASLRARLAAAEARTEALVTALEWYADETHYDEQGVVIGRGEGPKYIGDGDPQEAWYEGDFGERARAALAGSADKGAGDGA
jgi:hypothetical protein